MARSFVPLSARWGALLTMVLVLSVTTGGGCLRAAEAGSPLIQAIRTAPVSLPDPRDVDPGYVLLALNGIRVKWGDSKFGTGGVIRYAFVGRQISRPGARNCREIDPLAQHLTGSSIGQPDFAAEIVDAMIEWQSIADVRFELSADDATADLLIGAQSTPRGIAFADVIPGDDRSGSTAQIRHAAICFNPTLAWEIRADGKPATPVIRYVASHELGHVIGLDHSWHRQTLMNFRYHENIRGPQPLDVAGAVFLYGAPRPSVRTVGSSEHALPAALPHPVPRALSIH